MWSNNFTGLELFLSKIKELTITLHTATAQQLVQQFETAAKNIYQHSQLKMDVRDPQKEVEHAHRQIASAREKVETPK